MLLPAQHLDKLPVIFKAGGITGLPLAPEANAELLLQAFPAFLNRIPDEAHLAVLKLEHILSREGKYPFTLSMDAGPDGKPIRLLLRDKAKATVAGLLPVLLGSPGIFILDKYKRLPILFTSAGLSAARQQLPDVLQLGGLE